MRRNKRKLLSLFGIIFILTLVIALVSQIDKVKQIFSGASGGSEMPLTGTYLYVESIKDGGITPIMDEIKSLGMDTIITTAIKNKDIPKGSTGDKCSGPYKFVYSGEKNLEEILDAAASRNIKVYVGLIRSQGICAGWYANDILANEDAQETEAVVQWVNSTFPDHSAIAGWSIFNEPFLGYETNKSFLKGFDNYYQKQVVAIRKYSKLPIVTAPSLLNFDTSAGRPSTPIAIAERAENFLENTGVNILIFQDSVGAGAVPLSSWSQPYSLKDFFNAITQKVGSDHLWADVELFTWPSSDTDNGGGYRPTSITRLINQIKDTTSAGKRVVWIQQKFLSTSDTRQLLPGREPERLFDAYRATYQNIGTRIVPQNYTWGKTPDQKYGDNGNKLFDNQIGDPKLRTFKNWAGVNGSTEILFSFTRETPIWWVAFHFLQNSEFSIGFPDTYSLFCSQNKTDWNTLGSWNLPVSKKDSEYVFANQNKLNASCKYLKAKFDNPVWTFISEAEIIGPETVKVGDSNQCKILNDLCKKQKGLFCEMAKQRGCR